MWGVAAVSLLAVSATAGAVNDALDDRRRHEHGLMVRCQDLARDTMRELEAEITIQVAYGLTAVVSDDEEAVARHVATIRDLAGLLDSEREIFQDRLADCG